MSSEEAEETGELGLPFPHNREPLPRFANIVILMETLNSEHGAGVIARRENILLRFIQTWRLRIGDDIYPAVRLLFPDEDSELRQLAKLREFQVGRAFVDAMNLSPENPDALLLTSKRKSQGNHDKGDNFAFQVKRAVEKRSVTSNFSHLRIDEVTERIIKFANAARKDRAQIIRELIDVLNPQEFYWFVCILLRKISIHVSERHFLKLLHPNALQVYLVNKNMETVCRQLWSTDFTVTEKDRLVHLMAYFCPMRSKFIKGTAEDMQSVVDIIPEFLIEEKIDGERIQLHWDGTNVKFYSRRGQDFTSSYEQSIFADVKIEDMLAPQTKNCILDGEVVAWDPITHDVCGQSKVRELFNHSRASQYRHLVLVFDVVFLNDEVLTEAPLRLRKAKLEQLFPADRRKAGEGRVQVLPYKFGTTAQEIKVEFDRVMSAMCEGVVIKNVESRYELDGKSDSWIKVKPEFVDGYQGENLDLIVVGCYRFRGSHRPAPRFSAYLLALRDEMNPKRFVAFSKVGSGICLAMNEHFDTCLRDKLFTADTAPKWLDVGKERPPDFYVKPEDSLVFEVKYSEISSVLTEGKQNLTYGSGYSLRFPRYVCVREDKDVHSSNTVGEMLELLRSERRRAQNSKQAKRGAEPRLSLAKRIKREIDASPHEVVANVFNKRPFYICGDVETPKYRKVGELANIIRAHGGEVLTVYKPEAMALGDTELPKVLQLKSSGIPVIKPTYIFDCLANERMFTPEPAHYYCNAIPENGEPLVDQFGFSLFRQQSVSEIRECFNNMRVSGDMNLDRRTEVLDTIVGEETLHVAVFEGMRFYLSEPEMETLLSLMIRYGNGQIVDLSEATHMVVGNSHVEQAFSGEIVDMEWIFRVWNVNST